MVSSYVSGVKGWTSPSLVRCVASFGIGHCIGADPHRGLPARGRHGAMP
jgi:hypothetical protein